MRFAATILACVVGLGMASGQTHMQPEVRVRGGPYILPPPVITAQTDLVALEVVVRRPDGALVGGLSRDNFIVLDNGKRRVLATFSVETAPAPPMAAPQPAATGSAARDQKTEAGGFAAPPRSSAAPLRSIGLYFDDVSTDGGDLENARNAAERFVREALAPEDLVAVFTASGEQSLDFTRNAGELQAAVALIRAHPRAGRSLLMCPQITAYQAYLIAEVHEQSALQAAAEEFLHCPGSTARDSLTGKPMSLGEQNEYEEVLAQAEATWDQARGNSYNALAGLRAAVDAVARQPGSRMLLVASGGFLSATLGEQEDAVVQDALHAGVVINALDAKGLYTAGPGRPLEQIDEIGPLPLLTYFFEETSQLPMRQAEDAALVNLAQSTGGLFFHDNNDLTLGFYRLGMIPEITYQLAIAPGDIPRDGKYHRLQVEITPPQKAIVQARPGYFAPAPAASVAELRQRIDAAMRGKEAVSDVPAVADAEPGAGGVTVTVHMDVDRLPFHDKGRRFQDLYFIAGLFSSGGKFIAGKQGEMDLALIPATWRRLASEGLSAKLTLAAPPGSYRLRVVVGEFSDGALSASSRMVEVR